MADLIGEPHHIKLYNLPQRVEGGIKVHGCLVDGEETTIRFHHIDGAYSHCTVDGNEDKTVHLHASTPLVELGNDEWQIEGEPEVHEEDQLPGETQREALAKRGVDHDKYEVLLEHNRTIDDETTGIKVVRISDGKSVEAVINKSRRQLAEAGDTTYIDTIVDLVHKLEADNADAPTA